MRRLCRWLKSWFVSDAVGDDEYSVSLYKPIERQIYRYFDGKQVVSKDPLVIHRRVNDNVHALRTDIQVVNSDWKTKEKNHRDLLNTIRSIFDIKPLEEGGLTEQETADLLDHYLTYESFQKKIAKTSPTTPKETLPPPDSSSGGDSATRSTTGSGSTKEGPSTAEPPPSPTVPESPSA